MQLKIINNDEVSVTPINSKPEQKTSPTNCE